MGPKSKDAVVSILRHLVDELQIQRETGKATLKAVESLARKLDNQVADHQALASHVAELPRKANGNGH